MKKIVELQDMDLENDFLDNISYYYSIDDLNMCKELFDNEFNDDIDTELIGCYIEIEKKFNLDCVLKSKIIGYVDEDKSIMDIEIEYVLLKNSYSDSSGLNTWTYQVEIKTT